MVQSSLRGIDSHGIVALLPIYVAQARVGVGRPEATPAVTRANGAVAVVRGAGASGPRTARVAIEEAAALARANGVGAVVAAEVGYLGALWWIVEPVARDGLLAIAACNAMAFVAPHGGSEALHGTNPIAAAIPARPGPIVVDMRTNAFSMAEYWAAVAAEKPLPEGLLMATDGTPVTDPVALEREGWETAVSLPLAGARGYGLAVLVDCLTAALAGMPIGRDVGYEDERDGLALFTLVIDPASFGPSERFIDSVTRLATQAHEIVPTDPARPVRLPGERAAREHRARLDRGIPVEPHLWEALQQRLADLEIDVQPPTLQTATA